MLQRTADDLATFRVVMAACRHRGWDFAAAWDLATLAVYPDPGEHTRDVLRCTRSGWERAYVGQPPTPADRAVSLLLADAPDDPTPRVPTVVVVA
jgi:hypothetical protein